MKRLEDYVRSIPDFPEPGIIFRDVTTILQDADGLAMAVDQLKDLSLIHIYSCDKQLHTAYRMAGPYISHPAKSGLGKFFCARSCR